MRLNIQDQEETSIRPAKGTRSTFTCQADLCTRIDTSRYLDFLLYALAFQSTAVACLAEIWNRLTAAVTSRTGCGLNHLSQEGLSHLANFTLAVAGGTS